MDYLLWVLEGVQPFQVCPQQDTLVGLSPEHQVQGRVLSLCYQIPCCSGGGIPQGKGLLGFPLSAQLGN